tara:strand:+ start:5936 stop:8740 length:2805 start_codon:yes stop_codon:yes gene_type:complete
MSSIVNLIGSGYIYENLNILQNLNIKNFLRVYEVLGVEEIKIKNYGYIDKHLNLYKDIGGISNEDYPIINVSNKTDTEDTLIVNGNLNCNYFATFTTVDSTNDINIILADSYINDLDIQSNINVSNMVKSDVEIVKLEGINKSNSSYSENLIVNNDANIYDCNVFEINCNNLKNKNLNVLNNFNCNKFHNIRIRQNMDVYGNANIYGNLNIDNSLIVNGYLTLSPNSIFVLPKKSTNIYENSNAIINNGSLRYNDERRSIEYYNSGWKSITSLHSISYNSAVILHENNNSNTSNNISFIQNNNLSLEFNNITNNLNIYKDITIFNKNINIDGTIPLYPKDLTIHNDLTVQKDLIINNLMILGNNNRTNIDNGHIRFDNNTNTIQIFNNGWSKLDFFSEKSGIDMKDDIIDIFTNINVNRILCNSNTIDFHKNLNITHNLNQLNKSSTLSVDRNTNIINKIVFDNKGILEFDSSTNKLQAFVTPNYNNMFYSNYKYFDVNDYYHDCNIEYTSNVIKVLTNYDIYRYALNEFSMYNFINNNAQHYSYISTENTNCLIKSLEITYYIINNNKNNDYNDDDQYSMNGTSEIQVIDLIDLKNKYDILVHQGNKLIYDSSSNKTEFIIKKNDFYTLQVKLKQWFYKGNNNDVLLLIRLKGLYYSDLYFKNKQADFLYNIDNNFRNEADFIRSLNINKNITSKKTLSANRYYQTKIHSNLNNFSVDPNAIVSINNDNKYLFIKNNNVGIGRSILDKHLLVTKNPDDTHSLNIMGDSKIHKNTYVKNNIIMNNHCTNLNLIYKNVNTDNVTYNNNLFLKQNINSQYMQSKNLVLSNTSLNLLNNTFIENLVYNDKIYNIEDFYHKNITVYRKRIKFNTLQFDDTCNMALFSNECYNAFTVGDKIKPNLSISHDGTTEINCSPNGFILDNVNIFDKINKLNTF